MEFITKFIVKKFRPFFTYFIYFTSSYYPERLFIILTAVIKLS
jgi:hypothetical protein